MYINKRKLIILISIIALVLAASFFGFLSGRRIEKKQYEERVSQYQRDVMEKHLVSWYSIQTYIQDGGSVKDAAVAVWLKEAADTYETAYYLDMVMANMREDAPGRGNGIYQYYGYLAQLSSSREEEDIEALLSDITTIANWVCLRGQEKEGLRFYAAEDFLEIKDSLKIQQYLIFLE